MPSPPARAGAFARLRFLVLARLCARLHLLPEWRAILARSWSQRFIVLAVALSGAEVGFAVFANDPPLPRGVFAGLTALTSALAFYARLVAQRNLSGEPKQ